MLTKINASPALDSFTPLIEHHSKTPASFYLSKPVLYYYDKNARAVLSKNHRSKLPMNEIGSLENESETGLSIDVVEVFVSSE